MSLWSVHPRYLDNKGLISAWNRGLQLQKQLSTEPARNTGNSQLIMFSRQEKPLHAIGSYLSFIASEGCRRGYKFTHEKILYPNFDEELLPIDSEQLRSENQMLQNRLKTRDKNRYQQLSSQSWPETHPLFNRKTETKKH